VNHFNPITRNCANFTKSVLDRYFPGAAHRDLVNDFGMTSPKVVARSFTHYAFRHPELHLRILHFAQAPGTLKRSSEVRDGTEQLYHAKKLLIPMAIFAPQELGGFAAAYLLTGRFNPEHEWEKHPALEGGSAPKSAALTRTEIVGSSREWNEYRRAFDEIADAATREDPRLGSLDDFPKHLDRTGFPALDTDGALWMKVYRDGETVAVGLSASNVLAADSDPALARELVLSRVNEILDSPKHSRESMAEFRQDWARLQSFSRHSAGAVSAAAGN
jgi:hypothetical protein